MAIVCSGKGFAGACRLLLDGVAVRRSAWQKARAKKLQHSTRFDETIQ
jgi:hypothetical protein